MEEELLEVATRDLMLLFASALKEGELNISFNWEVSDKTVSEIGGRLIEDYILTALPKKMDVHIEGVRGRFEKCHIPKSQRAMEDIAFTWVSPNGEQTIDLLIDVKGHNELKKGSRPNLASIRKCRDFYSSCEKKELWIFYCRYTPVTTVSESNTDISYTIEDESFGDRGMFLLRRLSDRNMDPADIGSGGQILFAREYEIELVDRSREDMIEFLELLTLHIKKLKKERVAKKDVNNP